MSTRSIIALRNEDSIVSIYCHHDGYVSHNGRILHEHYTNREQVADLMTRGDMSVLGETVADCEFYNDRGEKTYAAVHSTFEELFNDLDGSDMEFAYVLLANGSWVVVDIRRQRVQMLDEAIAELETA